MNTIAHYTHPSGLSGQELRHENGSTLRVLDYGAHICSWEHELGEVLFVSSTADFKKGTAIRGGIPVIFPQFSRRGILPAHGFARTAEWTRFDVKSSNSDAVAVGLRLNDSPATREIWPHSFVLELNIELGTSKLGTSLSIGFKVVNSGAEQFSFTSALHTYLKVDGITSASVSGLENSRYINFLAADAECPPSGEELKFSGPLDRVYPIAPAHLKLTDRGGNRDIILHAANFPDAVVWNPWEENNLKMKDLHPNAYQEFVCVESGRVLEPLVLSPGAEVICGVTYEVQGR